MLGDAGNLCPPLHQPRIALLSTFRFLLLYQNKKAVSGLFILVGATGFEPAATGPPCRCATRLRHAPTVI